MFSKGGMVHSSKVCFFFRRGLCRYGENCKFQHTRVISDKGKRPEPSSHFTYFKLKCSPDAGEDLQSDDERIRSAEIRGQHVATGDMKMEEGVERKVTVDSPATTVTLVHLHQSTPQLKQEEAEKHVKTTSVSKPADSGSKKRATRNVTTGSGSPAQEEGGARGGTRTDGSGPDCSSNKQDSCDAGAAEASRESPEADRVAADKEELPPSNTKLVTDLSSGKRGKPPSLVIEKISVHSKDCDVVEGADKDDVIAEKTKAVGKQDAELVSMKKLTNTATKKKKTGASEEQADRISKGADVDDSGSIMAARDDTVCRSSGEDGLSEEEDKDTEGIIEQTCPGQQVGGYVGGKNTFVVSEAQEILLQDKEGIYQEAGDSVTEGKQENPGDGEQEAALVEEIKNTTELEADHTGVKEDSIYMDKTEDEVPTHALLTPLKPFNYLEVSEEENDIWSENMEDEDDSLLEYQQGEPFVAHPSHHGSRDLHVPVTTDSGCVAASFSSRKPPVSVSMEAGDLFRAGTSGEFQEDKIRKRNNGNSKMGLRVTNVQNSTKRKKINKQLPATKKMRTTKQIQKITAINSKSKIRQKGKTVSDLKKNERKLKKVLVQKKPQSRITTSGNKKGNIKKFKGKKAKNIAGEKKALKLKGKNLSARSNPSPGVNESSVAVKKPMFFDPHLPNEWCRVLNQRQSGKTAGIWDVYIVNPEGRRFRSRVQLKAYLNENGINLDADLFNFNPYGSPQKSSSHKISPVRKSVGSGQYSAVGSGRSTGVSSKKVLEQEETTETQKVGRSGRVIRSKFVVSELLGKSRKREAVLRQPTGDVKSSSENAEGTGSNKVGPVKVQMRNRPRKVTPTKIIRVENVSEGENTPNNVVQRQGRPSKIVPSKIIRVTALRNKVPVDKYPDLSPKQATKKDATNDVSLEHSDIDSRDITTKITLRKRNRAVEESERQQNKITKYSSVKYQQEELVGVSDDTSSVQSERKMRRHQRSKITASDLFTTKKLRVSPHTAKTSQQREAEAGITKVVDGMQKNAPKVVLYRLPFKEIIHTPEADASVERNRTKSDVDTESSPTKSRVTALAPPEEHAFYDGNLPKGWCRRVLLYREGVSTGIWKVYFKSPDGIKFHSQQELQSYIKNNKLGIESSIFKFSVFAEADSKESASEKDKLSKSQPESQIQQNSTSAQYSPLAQHPGIIKTKADLDISTKRQRRVRFDLKEVLGKKKLDRVTTPAKIAESAGKHPPVVDATEMQNSAQKKATGVAPELPENKSTQNRTVVSLHAGKSAEAVTESIVRTRKKSLELNTQDESTPKQISEQMADGNVGEQNQKQTHGLEHLTSKVQTWRVRRHSLPETAQSNTRHSSLILTRSEVPDSKLQLNENGLEILKKSVRLSSQAESLDTPTTGIKQGSGVRRVSGFSGEQSNVSRVIIQGSRSKNKKTEVISKAVENSTSFEREMPLKSEPVLPVAGLQDNRESRHLRQNLKRKFTLTELFRVKKKEVGSIPVSASTSKKKTKPSAGLNKSPQTKRARSASWPARSIVPMLIDPTLPKGWARVVKQRKSGLSAGIWNVYIYSPDGRRLRSKNELRAYLKEKNLGLDADSFDMSVSGKRYKVSEFQNGW